MGRKNPDRYTREDWRAVCGTVDSMRTKRWRVTVVCNRCHLNMGVDLRVMAFLLGGEGVLWNRHPHCRRVGCEGRVTFWAQPPEVYTAFPLRAEWPVRE
ncbi:hypothetical protein [Brevundimonas sp. SPF441]|uniref:Uncharacterized protein n=1 Tax=viral metagenome TaxID=1070528 RepID=A0A6M3XWG8_9ZZZZ|nr:hypothetical protein [Brevundimonas sp. SPF441]MBU1384777.1 hypothetical protein [Alphaproteobacteria bacterium]MBU2270401.1 hypothetical protein [Alphaproteobacteria bacterium]MBU2419569.1 hypothetical protein [Alphaproteobacteria bacterium]MRL68953.1 hypothetical protein [Brevundimonas sp. SPF441]